LNLENGSDGKVRFHRENLGEDVRGTSMGIHSGARHCTGLEMINCVVGGRAVGSTLFCITLKEPLGGRKDRFTTVLSLRERP